MFYSICRALAKLLVLIMGFRAEGAYRLPAKGPLIIAANHVSNWDPVIVAVSLKRPVYFMAKAELFENPLLSILFNGVHAFPVKRGSADRNAIRKAMDILEQGKVLGIFPEGVRKKVNPDASVHAGVAMLALKTGAPVVPVACIGTEAGFPLGWLRPFMVRVGKPINMDAYRDQKLSSSLLEEVSLEIMRQINALCPNKSRI